MPNITIFFICLQNRCVRQTLWLPGIKGCLSLKPQGNAVEVRNGKNIARRYELLSKGRMRLTYPLEQAVQDFQRIPA